LLATSDWRRADVYRREATALSSPPNTVWTVGHWGWQWYAAKAGMREYAPGSAGLAPGDLLVEPQTVHRQRISPSDLQSLRLIGEERAAATALDVVRTVTAAGGFYYYWAAVPWTVRSGPVETFKIYRVVATGPQASNPGPAPQTAPPRPK
jgi:hypothetical protein